MTKKESKKKYTVTLLIVLLLALAVGYAAFSDVLTITGTASIDSNAGLDLEFVADNPSQSINGCKIVSSQGIDTTNSGVQISQDKDTLTVTIADMSYPGAGAVVRAVIENVGSVPAKITSLTPTNISGNSHAIKIVGLNNYAQGESIAVGGKCTVEFTVQWDPTVTTLDSSAGENGNTFSFGVVLNYDQDTTPVTVTNTHTDA